MFLLCLRKTLENQMNRSHLERSVARARSHTAFQLDEAMNEKLLRHASLAEQRVDVGPDTGRQREGISLGLILNPPEP